MFKKLPVPFLFILLAGILLGFVLGFKSIIPYLYWDEMDGFSWHRMVLPHILNYFFWPFLVPMIYWTFLTFPIGKGANFSDRFTTFFLSLLVPLIHELITTVIYFWLLDLLLLYQFNPGTWSQLLVAFPGVYLGRIIEFWIIYGLFAAFDYYKRYRDKQEELGKIEALLTQAKLQVLRMQLQPHFLFNALNTISSLMDVDVKKAQFVVAHLGDLLRAILKDDNRVLVSLKEELDYVRAYLEIEKVRFEQRLSMYFDVDSEVEHIPVPMLLIQPLVENAVKHSIANTSKPVKICIIATLVQDHLQLIVEDDGLGSSKTKEQLFQSGIGLRNIRDRINALYGANASINIEAAIDKGFIVRLLIPINE